MVDPTAWAGAQLPSTENKGVTSILDAYSKGQQQNLYSQAIRKGEKVEADQAEIDRQGKIIVDFWKAGDRTAMMNQISELAKTSPEAAKSMKDTLFDLDKTNAFMGTMHLYNAAASDDPAAIETSLRKSKESYGVGIENPINTGIDAILNMEMGSEKQGEALMKSLAVADKWEMLTGGGSSGAAADRDLAERRVKATEERLDFDIKQAVKKAEQERLKREFEEKKHRETLAQRKLESGQWDATIYKDYQETMGEQYKASGEYRKFTALAEDFKRAKEDGTLGGFPRWAENKARDILGLQDKDSRLYAAWNYVRSSEVIDNLPQGPASDADIVMVERGALDRNAKPEAIEQVINGMAKLAKISDLYYSEKMKWMEDRDVEDKKRGSRGFGGWWKENGERLIKEAGIEFTPIYPEKEEPIDIKSGGVPKEMTQEDANLMIIEAARAKGLDPMRTPMAVLPGGRVIYKNGDGWYYADDDTFYKRVR